MLLFKSVLKGIVHPKIKILSSLTHPRVVTNLYEFICSAEHKGRYFEESLYGGTIDFHSRRKKNTMEVNGAPELLCFPHSSEYLPLCSAEQTHSYRFGSTWGWVNDDRIFIFGWTIPLSVLGNKVIHIILPASSFFCKFTYKIWTTLQVHIQWRIFHKRPELCISCVCISFLWA